MSRLGLCLLAAATALLAACAHTWPVQPSANAASEFKPADKADKIDYVDAAALAAFEAPVDQVYRVGEGDHLNVSVWGRPEVSGKHVVGPDGRITIALAGTIKVTPNTREEAARSITESLRQYYTRPAVTVEVEQYSANRVVVLGRVQNPGAINFDRPPTLLEALARAGSLPVIDKLATLTRVAIFRGREQVIWVDLKRLLNRGDLGYDIRLKPNDLVYIPDSFDTLVYVLGAVAKPGAYRLTPDMSLMDALSQAGGPNEDAAPQQIAIYRPRKKAIDHVPLDALLRSDRRNYTLEEGDVVFVPKSGIAEVGYVLRQLLPGLSFITLGSALNGH